MSGESELKKAMLIIDRGSKMKEVQHELYDTCIKLKDGSSYEYVDYCFLEVLPPYIDEGVQKCFMHDVDSVTVIPYFLYPGMKLKDAVRQTASLISKYPKKKIVISKPLSYQPLISKIVLMRIHTLITDNNLENTSFALLLIGHGSSDKRAKDAFIYTVNSLKSIYKNVSYCFLELEPPSIEEGIKECLSFNPESIITIPYFLHKGIHIQKDILIDIEKASSKYDFRNIYITPHIGVDPLIIELIKSLAHEAEFNSGLFKQ